MTNQNLHIDNANNKPTDIKSTDIKSTDIKSTDIKSNESTNIILDMSDNNTNIINNNIINNNIENDLSIEPNINYEKDFIQNNLINKDLNKIITHNKIL